MTFLRRLLVRLAEIFGLRPPPPVRPRKPKWGDGSRWDGGGRWDRAEREPPAP